MDPADKIGGVFNDIPKRIIHVLVVVPSRGATPPPTVVWKLVDEQCPVLVFQNAGDHIHIPEAYVRDSGLVTGNDGLRLYLRPDLRKDGRL
ncbi:unnamed protein product [Phytophthora lilii]|uniref:Unnamed protein product n=1 Tax=Phytophthora lilii TaxID=2077276 RepID=A0A9W6WKX3_9STRA|nr:unnamed protein product [Phytophthora lilii]